MPSFTSTIGGILRPSFSADTTVSSNPPPLSEQAIYPASQPPPGDYPVLADIEQRIKNLIGPLSALPPEDERARLKGGRAFLTVSDLIADRNWEGAAQTLATSLEIYLGLAVRQREQNQWAEALATLCNPVSYILGSDELLKVQLSVPSSTEKADTAPGRLKELKSLAPLYNRELNSAVVPHIQSASFDDGKKIKKAEEDLLQRIEALRAYFPSELQEIADTGHSMLAIGRGEWMNRQHLEDYCDLILSLTASYFKLALDQRRNGILIDAFYSLGHRIKRFLHAAGVFIAALKTDPSKRLSVRPLEDRLALTRLMATDYYQALEQHRLNLIGQRYPAFPVIGVAPTDQAFRAAKLFGPTDQMTFLQRELDITFGGSFIELADFAKIPAANIDNYFANWLDDFDVTKLDLASAKETAQALLDQLHQGEHYKEWDLRRTLEATRTAKTTLQLAFAYADRLQNKDAHELLHAIDGFSIVIFEKLDRLARALRPNREQFTQVVDATFELSAIQHVAELFHTRYHSFGMSGNATDVLPVRPADYGKRIFPDDSRPKLGFAEGPARSQSVDTESHVPEQMPAANELTVSFSRSGDNREQSNLSVESPTATTVRYLRPNRTGTGDEQVRNDQLARKLWRSSSTRHAVMSQKRRLTRVRSASNRASALAIIRRSALMARLPMSRLAAPSVFRYSR